MDESNPDGLPLSSTLETKISSDFGEVNLVKDEDLNLINSEVALLNPLNEEDSDSQNILEEKTSESEQEILNKDLKICSDREKANLCHSYCGQALEDKSIASLCQTNKCMTNTEEDASDELLSQLENELNDENFVSVSLNNDSEADGGILDKKQSTELLIDVTVTADVDNVESNHKIDEIQTVSTDVDCNQISSDIQMEANVTTSQIAGAEVNSLRDYALSPDTGSNKNVQENLSVMPNGIIPKKLNLVDTPEFKTLQKKHERLKKFFFEKEEDVNRLSEQISKLSDELFKTVKEKDRYINKIEELEKKSSEKIYLQQIAELKEAIETHKKEHEETKQKLSSHDTEAKKKIHDLQNDMQVKLTKITRAYEECKRDKEGMVVKYAMAEQKNLELQEKMSRNDRKVRDMERERDNAITKFKQIKAEKEKSDGNILARGQEIVNLRREIEKQKELRAESESRAKWANNKLKQELDSHKESKQKFEELSKKHKHLKDESDQVRRDCQSMIKEYQQAEGAKSLTLASKLDEKQLALQQQEQEKKDVQEVHFVVKNELDTLKRKHKEMIEELRTYKDKVTCLEAERIHQEETLTKFKNTLQAQKQDNRDLHEKLAALEEVELQLENAKRDINNLKLEIAELSECNKDLRQDIDGCAKRESGHLEFSKRVSDKNAKLQSENSVLSNKLANLQLEHDSLQTSCTELKDEIHTLKQSVETEKCQRIEENGSLRQKLEEKSKTADDLLQKLVDQKDENKTLKRRHQANIKDLTRQLQQTRRKLEIAEGKCSGNGERDSQGSMGSRTSSTNSMNTIGQSGDTVRPDQLHHPLPQEEDQPIVQFVEVDKQILVEKIVKLQRVHARKNEKLEFMEDHVNQLVEELQKKHRIIQSYALREEIGALAPSEMDLNKAQLSRKGGIMASVYNKHSSDDHMTLDLSLEINRKLQAVLEDTLLKNITLKDNMDTLGKEIATISQSNRELQLQIQTLKGTIS